MAVLGWIAMGLMTALLRSSFRRGAERRDRLARSSGIGIAGALVAGLVATGAGVGALGDFFHSGAWLIAFGGAVLALAAFDGVRRSPRDKTALQNRLWTERAGGESEKLNRNW